jgi:DNA-binding HxlR family transcriptional regulator
MQRRVSLQPKGVKTKILQTLAHAPKNYSEIKAALNLSDHVLSYNLKKMLKAGQIEKERGKRGAYRITPLGILSLNNITKTNKESIQLYRITNGVQIPLLSETLNVPIDVFVVADEDIDLKTAMQNLAGTVNTLARMFVDSFSAEVARQRGVKTELELDFKPSIIAKKQKYDFEATALIHFNGHSVLQNVNWEALAAKAEALDRQVKNGLGIIKRNLQNEDFKAKLRQSFVEKFGEKHGLEIFATLLEFLGK